MLNKNEYDWSAVSLDATLHSRETVRQQLDKITSSPEFHATRQQRDFLVFVVMETLAGRAEDLKGYSIATQVFGRPEDFNVSVDPIVSIQANKLRRALERYYLIDGKLDPLRIDIPKGTYVPTIVHQKVAESPPDQDDAAAEPVLENSWPTILILPFKNLTGDPEQNFLGSGISTEMAIEVSRFENIRVLYPRDGMPSKDTCIPPRFILNGELYKGRSGIKLAVRLVDTHSGLQIWGDTCKTGGSVGELYTFREQVALGIATTVCGEFGVITRAMSKETKNKLPEDLSTYEAILRFWEYEQTMTAETFGRAFAALTHAVEREPDCSVTLGSLAILYATICNLDIPGFENPFENAVRCAERAAVINPNNQRILAILAYIRFMSNELPEAIHEAHRALDFNPHSLFVVDGLAWILTLSGDWEHGPRLARNAINHNPFHRAVAHDALWVNYLRQEEYDLAYRESCSRHRPNLFWDPLMKASSLGLAGNIDEGRKWAERLLQLRPDFPEKGGWLIGKYIKFDEIHKRIVTGLSRSGVEVEPLPNML